MWMGTFLPVSWTTDHAPSPLNAQAIASCSLTITWECKLKEDVPNNREVKPGQIVTIFQGIMCNTLK